MNGSLHDVLHNASSPTLLSLEKRVKIAIKIANVIAYSHGLREKPVIYSSLRSSSILIDENFEPRISAFHFSRMLGDDDSINKDVDTDSDPVYSESAMLSRSSDVYSFGVILLELITRMKTIDGDGRNLVQTFLEACWNEKIKELFDKEIAATLTNIEIIMNISVLAASCLRSNVRERPDMQFVATQLEAMHPSAFLRKFEFPKAYAVIDRGSFSKFYGQSGDPQYASMEVHASDDSMKGANLPGILKKFSVTEVLKITRAYKDCIGKHDYGEFYKVELDSGVLVVVKTYNEKEKEAFENEVQFLSLGMAKMLEA